MASIFLCHATEDKPIVREVYKRLKEEHFNPWLDEEDLLPGQLWEHEIRNQLRKSEFVLIFLSEISVNKIGFVQNEFKLALNALENIPEGTIHTIPVRIDNTQIPDQFERFHWVNIYDDNGIDKIVKSIREGMSHRNNHSVSDIYLNQNRYRKSSFYKDRSRTGRINDLFKLNKLLRGNNILFFLIIILVFVVILSYFYFKPMNNTYLEYQDNNINKKYIIGINALIIESNQSYYDIAGRFYFKNKKENDYDDDIIVVAKKLREINLNIKRKYGNEIPDLGGEQIPLNHESNKNFKVLVPKDESDLGIIYIPVRQEIIFKSRIN